MADRIEITPGTGAFVATDEVTRNTLTEHQQIVKIGLGADGAHDTLVDSGQQTMANSVPVAIASDQSPIEVIGDIAHNTAAGSINPILIGGYGNNTAPGDVTSGNLARAWFMQNGARAVNLTAAGALIGGDATNGLDTDVTRFPNRTTIQDTITAIQDSVQLALGYGYNGVAVIITGTWVGTIEVEVTANGTDWISHTLISTSSGLAVSNVTANATLFGSAGAFSSIRVRASAWTSGTATIYMAAHIATETVHIENALQPGNNNIGDVDIASIAAGDNNIGNVDIVTVPAPLSTTGGGTEATALRVTVATDSTGVLSVDDNGASLTVDGTVNATAAGDVAHDGVDSGNPVKIGYKAIAHGSNPTAVAANDRTDGYANRHGVPWVIGGHPNIQTVRLQFTAAQTDVAVITVGAGSKIVVTALQVTLDNASTVFPSVRIGFGTANTPTTTGVVAAHGGVPAGGGFSRGDGSGIIGIGADNEDLRITTVGAATGNGVEVIVTYYTIES